MSAQHEPKEPRRAPTREEFAQNVRRIIHGTVGPSSSDLAHSLLAAFDALLERADKAEAERDAALAKLNDWRFARWRELPEAERKVAGDLLNQFGHLAKDGPHKEKARLYWWAMDCLEALGEK